MKTEKNLFPPALFILILAGAIAPVQSQHWMGDINRSTVAVSLGGDSIYIVWRMLGTDPENIGFNLYRISGNEKAVKLNRKPLTETTDYFDVYASNGLTVKYFVKPAGKKIKL